MGMFTLMYDRIRLYDFTAVINWVPAQRAYQITCMSKNGMVVAGSYHAKGGKGKSGERERRETK